VFYLLGMARNRRLEQLAGGEALSRNDAVEKLPSIGK
jgi:hypothetical protein